MPKVSHVPNFTSNFEVHEELSPRSHKTGCRAWRIGVPKFHPLTGWDEQNHPVVVTPGRQARSRDLYLAPLPQPDDPTRPRPRLSMSLAQLDIRFNEQLWIKTSAGHESREERREKRGVDQVAWLEAALGCS